jgi:hypothetical protein
MSKTITSATLATPKIKFKAFAIYVTDIDESRLFYRRLGYKLGEFQHTEDYMFITVRPPGSLAVGVELRESTPAYAGRNLTVFSMIIEKGLEDTLRVEAQVDIIEDLLLRGFNFANLTPKEFYMCEFGRSIEMFDPQGACIEILLPEQ